MRRLSLALALTLAAMAIGLLMVGCDSSKDSEVSAATGTGGSMARFAITGNTLYIVTKESLEVYNIANPSDPQKEVTKNLGMGIETIFPYNNYLFIGANDGMHIFDNTKPNDPFQVSAFYHIQSCDPVVVQGNYAYVTLRGGRECRPGNIRSSLDVVDISNPKVPQMITTQTIDSPYGLGVWDKTLFVCTGDAGLKVMDISSPANPKEVKTFRDVPSYDVIVRKNRLLVIGAKGLFQYSFNAENEMKFLSQIPVQ